jgi:periplasmic divalent cation tolerance protein
LNGEPASSGPGARQAQGQILLVLTSCPDADTAARLRRLLVDSRLAACVNQLAPVTSTYRWQGGVEEAVEVPLLIKTSSDRYAEVQAALRAAHPYQLPEIIALPVSCGLPEYIAWVLRESEPAQNR